MSSFIPFCLKRKCWLSLRAFWGVAVSVRGLLQDSFHFPIWMPGVSVWDSAAPESKEEFLQDICWEHPAISCASAFTDHPSEIARCRSGVQSSVVFCGCLLILTRPWHALDMPGAAWRRENEGAMERQSPWSICSCRQRWSCLQLCSCRTSLGGENELCTVCACTQLPYKN